MLLVLSLFILLEVPKSCIAFEYFIFPQSWPKGFCEKQIVDKQNRTCHPKIPKKFIIHGLWPEPISTDRPIGAVNLTEEVSISPFVMMVIYEFGIFDTSFSIFLYLFIKFLLFMYFLLIG